MKNDKKQPSHGESESTGDLSFRRISPNAQRTHSESLQDPSDKPNDAGGGEQDDDETEVR